MNEIKKNTAEFHELDASQMRNINGGEWVYVKLADGTLVKIWR